MMNEHTISDRLNAIIVDDEQDGREVLLHLLDAHGHRVKVIGQATNANDAQKLIAQLKPDLVFLDIQMAGKSGFSVLEGQQKIPYEVIFVTSYAQYALTAIKFNALDYLLKPLDKNELTAAIEKAYHKFKDKRNSEAQILSLLQSLDQQKNLKKIAVHIKDAVLLIDQVQILYIEGQGSYCKICLHSGETYIIASLIKEVEQYFDAYSSLIRISKRMLVNTDFITAYSKGEPCLITLKKEITFEVSRRKKQEILDKLRARLRLN